MTLDDFKWHGMDFSQSQLSKEKLMGMLGVNKNAELKKIKAQMIIETVAWTGFLAVYYDFFDGHLKPATWNALLVLAVGLVLVHNLLSYRITNNPVNGSNILDSLRNYLVKIKRYAYVSIGARVTALLTVFGFFMSSLEAFEPRHYWALICLGVLVLVQALVLWKTWSKRIVTIANAYGEVLSS